MLPFSLWSRLFLLPLSISFLLSLAAVAQVPDVISVLTSSDAMGRGPNTEGLRKSREALAGALKDLEITPAFGDGKYFQEFPFFAGNRRLSSTSFGEFAAKDFVPMAFSKSGTLSDVPLVFVGYGITLKEKQKIIYDDYRGFDVRGKAVIVLLGDPGIGNEKSLFRNPEYVFHNDRLHKAENAILHGAKAIIFVDPTSNSEKNFGADALIPSSGAVLEILALEANARALEPLLGNKKFRELQDTIARTQIPQSFALNRKVSLNIALEREVGMMSNVAGIIPGSSPTLAKEIVVLGAHYDHLGIGGERALDPELQNTMHPGADDNASGVQAVLNLAARLKQGKRSQRSYWIVFFSGEELGLLGSRFFSDNPPLEKGAKIVAMLNFDMVGRMRENTAYVFSADSANEFPIWIENANRKLGLNLAMNASTPMNSDHAAFLEKNIPTIFFHTGPHADYHRATDTADRLNKAGISKIVDLAHEFILRLDSLKNPPTYNTAFKSMPTGAGSGRNYGAYFGSIPDFAEGNKGVLLRGTRTSSPAEKLGLKEKDLLVGLGDVQIRNLHDFVFALRTYKPNDEVNVRWIREGKAMEAKVKLEQRAD